MCGWTFAERFSCTHFIGTEARKNRVWLCDEAREGLSIPCPMQEAVEIYVPTKCRVCWTQLRTQLMRLKNDLHAEVVNELGLSEDFNAEAIGFHPELFEMEAVNTTAQTEFDFGMEFLTRRMQLTLDYRREILRIWNAEDLPFDVCESDDSDDDDGSDGEDSDSDAQEPEDSEESEPSYASPPRAVPMRTGGHHGPVVPLLH